MNGWISPCLGIRFDTGGTELRIFAPDGQSFVSFSALKQQREAARIARQQAAQRAVRLAARLRKLGIDPDAEDETG
jgi:hypothetical protein